MPRSMSRLARIAVIAALAALALVPATTAAQPGAQASKSCGVGSGRHLGPTYVLALGVSHTSCKNGRTLVRSYNSCRRRHGGRKGHCSGTLGYSCSERRFNKSSQSFDARVKCSKGGGRRINHTYTQFT
jgi:hypothetical protein